MMLQFGKTKDRSDASELHSDGIDVRTDDRDVVFADLSNAM
jgi:hypothetical protein